MNINEIFENKMKRSYVAKKKNYDVRVTLIKNGKGGFCIRFGFINDAVDAIGENVFIEVSMVEKLKDKIYFRFDKEKKCLSAHKLATGRGSAPCKYVSITPSKEAEKIYRNSWIGKTFKIKHDEEHKLYYIELEELA